MDPATINAGIVAILALAIAFASWRAMLHTGNRGLYFVIAAFVILGLKGIAKAYTLSSGMLETRETETVFSYMDLAAIGIIAWPILMRRRDS